MEAARVGSRATFAASMVVDQNGSPTILKSLSSGADSVVSSSGGISQITALHEAPYDRTRITARRRCRNLTFSPPDLHSQRNQADHDALSHKAAMNIFKIRALTSRNDNAGQRLAGARKYAASSLFSCTHGGRRSARSDRR